ncbi:MerR family DNA-binding transcriptional regulator [[Clostridium] colinum]|uniref:MerR family DNA-binding transcriptional regulator n=1 Tax=[Clostridium] colinum TaxID=36835 RepID=UPI002024E086|nr:MerR family DNA-binding transcriptional regulator [[Clostridium] colinum]
MEEFFEKYFTISQFAKMYNVNKKTLIYYDEIGLFKPALVKENGYRYYTLHQGGLFEVILILKQLGMPLKTIKYYLEKREICELKNILLEQKYNIENQMLKLKKINNIINNRLNILDSYKSIKICDMEIKYMDEEYLILSNYTRNVDEITTTKNLYEHTSKIYKNNLYEGFGLGAMIQAKDIINNNYLNYSYFYTKVEKLSYKIDYFIKPKGNYLVFYYKGHWQNFYKIYDKAKQYLKDNNINITGYSYEEFILDDATSKTADEYVTKFMIQIS